MDKVNFELDYETRDFRPTVDWMRRRYDEANEKLFGGALGKCDFKVFTSGRGSRGGTNGWFRLTGENIRVNPYINYLYVSHPTNALREYKRITASNFYDDAKPRIELNGNKRGSEWAFMVTLVHEMCHYYTYMNGIRPAQGHGRDFKKIAKQITELTDGQIEVTTRTTEDRSKHFVYDKVKSY
jgi:hypothetical protein